MKSKFEKKSLFKKIVAVVCAMAMLLSMSIPYTALAKAADVTSITFVVDESIDGLMESTSEVVFDDGEGFTLTSGKNTKDVSVTLEEAPDGKVAYKLTPAGGNFDKINSIDILVFSNYSPKIGTLGGIKPGTPALDEDWGAYTVKFNLIAASGDVTVTIDEGEPPAIPEYEVYFTPGTQYKFTEVIIDGVNQDLASGDSFVVKENQEVKFKVEANSGCRITRVSNGKTIYPDSEGYYSFNVTGDVDIAVTASKLQYSVTYDYDNSDVSFTVSENPVKENIEHNSTYTFNVVTTEGYGDPKVTATAGNASVNVMKNGNQYSFYVTGDTVIKVESGAKNEYNVTLNAGEGYSFESSAATAEHGSDFTFKLNLNEDYNQSTPVVKANGAVVNADENGVYTIKNVTERIEVTVDGVVKNPYVISGLASSDGYTVAGNDIRNGKVNVTGREYSFYITAAEGYGTPSVTVDNGAQIINEGSRYTITNITGDVNVTIKAGAVKTYNVTFPNVTGCTFEHADEPVAYNGSYEFKVNLDAAYNKSADNLVVKANNVTLAADNGVYTINNVTSDVNVTVTGVSLNTYTISGLTAGDGYELQGSFSEDGTAQVTHGSDYSFYVTSVEGRQDPTVTANGKPCIKNGSQYIIQNVTADTAVTIDAGSAITYTVTLNSGVGFEYADTSDTKVEYGKDFTFKLNATEGYDVSQAVVKVNSQNLAADEDGVYAISNITSNTIVDVSNIVKKTYQVTLNAQDGATITASTLTVAHGDDFHFTVALDTGYRLVAINVNGNKLDGGQVGMNTITGVTSNVAINVVVEKNAYNVTVNNGEFTTTGITGTVNYGDSVSFKVDPNSYYKVTRVTVNGTEYFADSTGTYTVSNVTTGLNINVSTTPVTITINYMGGKWADNKTVTYTYEGKASIDKNKLEKVVSSEALYEFNGWAMSNDALNFDTKADKTVTLTAQWVDNKDFIQESIELTTLHQRVSDNTVTIRTYIDVSKFKYNNEFRGAQVIAYGTLLTRANVKDADIYKMQDKLLRDGQKLSGNADGTGLLLEGFKDDKGNSILNYYHIDYTFDPLEMNDVDFTKITIKGFVDETIGSYRALGWIKIRVGEEIITIFGDAWDADFSKSTDPVYIETLGN